MKFDRGFELPGEGSRDIVGRAAGGEACDRPRTLVPAGVGLKTEARLVAPWRPVHPAARHCRRRDGWRGHYIARAFNRAFRTLMSISAPVAVARALASRTSA